MIGQSQLDALWDFDDPALSQRRFQEALDAIATDASATEQRGELLTQLARAAGLQDDFARAAAILGDLRRERAADPSVRPDDVVGVRIALEGGRIANSSGDRAAAIPLFEDAAALARTGGHEFLEIDALHMLAIADSAQSDARSRQAIELAEASDDPRTQRWLVSLYNNRGWTAFDAGEFDDALAQFRLGALWADRVGTEQQRVWASEAIEECLAAQVGERQARPPA